MSKRFSKWAFVFAVLAGGALFQLGCNIGGLSTWTLLAILQEDAFG
jgi:hypothetical protein